MMAFYKSERFETPLNADLDAFRLQQRQWKAARGRRNREPGARLLVGCGKISAREVDECFYEHFMSGMDDGTALRQANLISCANFRTRSPIVLGQPSRRRGMVRRHHFPRSEQS